MTTFLESLLNENKELKQTLEELRDLFRGFEFDNTKEEFVLERDENGQDPTYVLTLKVPHTLTNKDIRIEFKRSTARLTIEYSICEGKNMSCNSKIVVDVPLDAVFETLDARVSNGILTVTVKRATYICDEDTTKVGIRMS